MVIIATFRDLRGGGMSRSRPHMTRVAWSMGNVKEVMEMDPVKKRSAQNNWKGLTSDSKLKHIEEFFVPRYEVDEIVSELKAKIETVERKLDRIQEHTGINLA